MKKIALFSLLTISSAICYAQLPEDFNTKCATAATPSSWRIFNPLTGTETLGAWTCTATNGRPTTGGSPTPGVQCTGYYSSVNNLDTSYLISPLLNMLTTTNYPDGKVYMRFDTKKDNILNGARIGIQKVHVDTLINPALDSPVNFGAVNPTFGDEDATDWVTHEVDLSSYIDKAPFYVAFRYTSTTATGSIWYLDNINLSPKSLAVENRYVDRHSLPLFVIGNSLFSKIALSYTVHDAGTYHISIYDMMGRMVHNSDVAATKGTSSYAIDGLSLRPGMYCVKMNNETSYGTTKLMIQ